MRPVLEQYHGYFNHIDAVPNSQLREYYGRSSVFVLPSIEDGCAIVCGEAMACGLPVITTSSNGASEVLEHGKDGFVVPPRSPELIAEYIERLYRDKILREEMSAAALAKARSELSWESYALRLVDIYRTVIETGAHSISDL
jgi:glycosyltransferase involved in cell wall biosynthesis